MNNGQNFDPNGQYNQYGQEQYGQEQYVYQTYTPIYIPHPDAKRSNGLSIAGFICGLVGLGSLSLILCIVGMVLSTKGKKLSMSIYGVYNKMAKVGFILSLIGIISSAVFTACICSVYAYVIAMTM